MVSLENIIWAGTFFIMGVGITIIGNIISNWFQHKQKIDHMKKEFFFKEKMKVISSIGDSIWKQNRTFNQIKNLQNQNSIESNFTHLLEEINLEKTQLSKVLEKRIFMGKILTKKLDKYNEEIMNFLIKTKFKNQTETNIFLKKRKSLLDEIEKEMNKEIKGIN